MLSVSLNDIVSQRSKDVASAAEETQCLQGAAHQVTGMGLGCFQTQYRRYCGFQVLLITAYRFARQAIISFNVKDIVSNNVLAVIDLELPEWTQTIANPISTNGS